MEIGAFVSGRPTEFGDECAPAEGVVTGWVTIDGSPVCVFAQDSAAMGGAVSEMQAKKICALYDYALKTGVPVIGIFDSKGAKIAEGVDALGGYAKIVSKVGYASGIIPQVAVVSGICGGAAAIAASCFDFIIGVDRASFTAFATVVRPLPISPRPRLWARLCRARHSRLRRRRFGGRAIVKALLSLSAPNNSGDKNYAIASDDINRALDPGALESGDARAIIAQIADNGRFLRSAPHTQVQPLPGLPF